MAQVRCAKGSLRVSFIRRTQRFTWLVEKISREQKREHKRVKTGPQHFSRKQSLCGSLSHFSTMTTPAKVRKVAIYRAAGMWDGYGPLQREPEPISYPWMCPIPVPSSLFSGNTYSRAGLASTAAFRRHISSHRHKPLRSIPLLSRHR